MIDLNPDELKLLNTFQRGFPLSSRPFEETGRMLGMDEASVIALAAGLKAKGVITRLGAVTRPNTAGASTLAAMAVPDDDVQRVADIVSALPEVNHNYQREHDLNLWFVVTAADRKTVDTVLRDLENETGLDVIDLPLEREYRIDLGFSL